MEIAQATKEQVRLFTEIVNLSQEKTLLDEIKKSWAITNFGLTPLPKSRDAIEVSGQLGILAVRMIREKVERYAAEARLTANEHTRYLCKPVKDCDLLGLADEFEALFGWGTFNPFGPTITALMLVDVPGGKEVLLFGLTMNPFAEEAVVYGLMPKDVSQAPDHLDLILTALFDGNGRAEAPLFGSLPTHVVFFPESRISIDKIKELFFKAATIVKEDLNTKTEQMKKYRCDPWGRASAAVGEFFGEMRQYLQEEKKKDQFKQKRRIDAIQQKTKLNSAKIDQFERWWDIVTEPEHVRAEISEMQRAWEGATNWDVFKGRV
jgi:hypothetical protein